MPKTPKTLFPIGRIIVLPEAAKWLKIAEVSASSLLNRHARGEWGGISRATEQDNHKAITTQGVVESCHPLGFTSVWIATDLSKNLTTLYTFDDHFEV